MKARVLSDAVRRTIAQDTNDRLRKGMEKLLDACAAGERWALELIRDTLDGKPRQSIDASADEPVDQAATLAAFDKFISTSFTLKNAQPSEPAEGEPDETVH